MNCYMVSTLLHPPPSQTGLFEKATFAAEKFEAVTFNEKNKSSTTATGRGGP